MGETDRPYVLLSAAMSVDGFLDRAGGQRLTLSGPADLARLDAVRAGCDAILVGANTVRRDNPRLLVRSAELRAERSARGVAEQPLRVTVTASGALDATARLFTDGAAEQVVYCADPVADRLRDALGGRTSVVAAGPRPELEPVLADLAGRGVRRLLVEGGSGVHTWFLTAGLVDELHLVVAPFFVGQAAAPRLVGAGVFPHGPDRPMELVEAVPVGEVVLLRYRLTAVDGSRRGCP